MCNIFFRKYDDSDWEEIDFQAIREDDKFSESLKILLRSTCRRPIGKPEISLKLAEFLEKDEIIVIEPIKKLFNKIEEIIR